MQKDKKQPELADIFRKYGEEYRKSHFLSTEQSKTMYHIEICRTAVLGGHSEACDHCGYKKNAYNSCRDRHCPKCQTLVKEKWLNARKSELLPCPYYVDSVVMQSSGYNSLPLQTIFTEYCT